MPDALKINPCDHEYFMRQAIQLSIDKMNQGCGGPFGAVIVRGGQIIGQGWNQVTSTCDPTAHAEMTAIRDACSKIKDFNLSGSIIYTSCEPCPMCLSAIYWARIDKIYYGNTKNDAAAIDFDDAFLYTELTKAPQDRTLEMIQISHGESIKAFDMWREKMDKIPY